MHVPPAFAHAPQCYPVRAVRQAQQGERACIDASRAWLYAPAGGAEVLRTLTLTAKMTPDASGQLYAPLRETTISRKTPAGMQLHALASVTQPHLAFGHLMHT